MQWLVLVLAFVFVALPVDAADGISLATVSAPTDSPSQGAAVLVGQIARQSFKRNPRYDVLEISAVLRANADWPAQRRQRQAEEALANAQAAYDAFELEPTLEALAEAIIGFEQALAAMEDITPIVEAYKLQGATYALKGDTKNASRAFAKVFMLDPGATLGDEGFPDTVQSLFEQEREQAFDAKTGGISVFSAPNAAEVWLDGSFVGVTPVTVDSITVGRHFLRVVKDGYENFGTPVDVAREQERNVQATMRAEKKFAEYDDLTARLGKGSEQGAAELARFLKVDQLFWTQVQQNGDQISVTGMLLDGVSGEPVVTQQKTFQSTSSRFRSEVEMWVSNNFRKSLVSGQTIHTKKDDDGDSLIPEAAIAPPTPFAVFAGWTFLGAAVVGAGAGTVLGMFSLSEWDYYRNGGDWFYEGGGIPNQLSTSIPNSQESYAIFSIAADVSWALAIGCGVAGGVFLYLGLQQKQDIEDVLVRGDDPSDAPPAQRFATVPFSSATLIE
ncbi:MAG: PEGA domain-containing protein [Deltaproteobacteria bacterium]|nr:PEGA domain-containing protein [Deltaproteobacteria bacterium]